MSFYGADNRVVFQNPAMVMRITKCLDDPASTHQQECAQQYDMEPIDFKAVGWRT